MAKTVKRARKTATKTKATQRKAAAKKRTVKKKPTAMKAVKKKATARSATKKKAAKKEIVKKKAVKKATKKMVVKKTAKSTVKKKAVPKMAPKKRRKKRSEPLFDRIVPTRPPEPATGDNPYHIKIVNMVASANFNVELDLFALAREVDTIEYEPEQFPGAILKLTKDGNGVKASLLLFKNGKIICTGARSEEEVEQALMITSGIIADYVS